MSSIIPWQNISRLARRGEARSVISVICFHQVLRQSDVLRPSEPNAEQFEQIVISLKRYFHIIRLADTADFLNGQDRRHAVVLTFDDGYENNFAVAAPILEKHNVPATFFVASGYLDNGCMWNDVVIESIRKAKSTVLDFEECGLANVDISSVERKRATIDKLLLLLKHKPHSERQLLTEQLASHAGLGDNPSLMMNEEQVCSLYNSRLFDIGAHTVSHPILSRLPDSLALSEIQYGKKQLEDIVGSKIDLFAYPNGRPGRDFSAKHVEMVREAGFRLAVTTSVGGVRKTSHELQLPRQTVWHTSAWRVAASLINGSRLRGETLARCYE